MSSGYQIVLVVVPTRTRKTRSCCTLRELRNALIRLEIDEDTQGHVFGMLKRGSKYHILGLSLADETASFFGFVFF